SLLSATPELITGRPYPELLEEHVYRPAGLLNTEWTGFDGPVPGAATGYGDYGEAQEFIDSTEQSIYQLARTAKSSTVHLMYDVVKNSFLQLQAAFERGKHVTGVPTGFSDLDNMTSGMHEGEL
ncbi:hypothetical protein QMK94_28205, partial [Klebsiella pneumoniae]